MNDFTKEELESLIGSLDVCIADNGADKELINKLQSMIDNYDCEHFGVIRLDDNFIPVSPETCLHCGKEMK